MLIRGVIYSVGILLGFFLAAALLEYFGRFETTFRAILFFSLIAAAGFVIGKFIALPLLKLNKLGKTISHEQASEIIGSHFTEVKDKLLNVLQLKKQNDTDGGNILVLAGIDQKTQELNPVPFAAAIDLNENRKYLKYALPPLFIFLITLIVAPHIITDSTQRLVNYNQYYEPIAPFQFILQNTDLKGVQQEDYELNVKLTGSEIPDNVFIQIGANEYKLQKTDKILFNYTFKNLQKNTKFRFNADGFYSKEYTLEALPKPTLLDFDITLVYPKYLKKKDELVKNTGDLIVPSGTKIAWKFNTKNTNAMHVSFGDSALSLMPSTENGFSFSQRVVKDINYSITTSNQFFKSKDSVVYAINVIPDLFPSIDVRETKDSVYTKRLYFNGSVKDDHGFSRLTFNYRYTSAPDSLKERLKLQTITMPVSMQLNQDQYFYDWDLSKFEINPGDEIEYYFEVFDNDGVMGAKAARTQKMIFKAPTLRELSEQSDKNSDQIKKEMQDALKENKKMQKEIDELQKKMTDKKNLTWDEKKKMDDLLEKQKNLQEKMEQMKNENEINNKQKQEFNMNSESIMDKQKQLEEMFDQMMDPEMKKKYEELQKLLEQMDKNKMQNELDKMELDAKDLEKQLDRQLEMFKQLEFEQKLEDITNNLDDLSKKQDDLSKESEKKDADAKEIEKKQEELNKEFENIQKDLDELNKMNEELENKHEMPNTEKQEQDIKQEQQKSSEQLQKDQKKGASKSQKSAAQKMQEMSQQMASMQQEMEQESQEEDINSLRQILSNLVQLSFDQEALMQQMSKVKTDNPDYTKLIQQQKKLKDDSKIIEDSLLALSKRVAAIKPIVNKEITSINFNMDKSIDHYVDALGDFYPENKKMNLQQGNSKQQYAMTSINNLALLLSEALNQMQMDAQKQGNGSCNKPGKGKKPGNGQGKPSASSMKKMQEQLNKQIEALKKAMEQQGKQDGGKKGDKEGKKGENGKQGQNGMGGYGGTTEQLVKMAAQQEALRKMMQQLMQEGGGNPGDFKNAMKLMEQTETDLVNKQITQETIKRQQEILNKLLDFEKAEKEKDMEEKRESKDGKNNENGNLIQFLEYNRQKQKEAELLKTLPPSLTPYYKNKVTEYFNNIEQ